MNKISLVIFMSILIVLTGATALSAHALFIQYLTSPSFSIPPELDQIVGGVIRFATVVGAILIYKLSEKHWVNLSLFYRVLLFALLLMALSEQFLRFPLMQIVTGVPWSYQLLATVPTYVGYLTLSLFLCLLMPILISKSTKFIFLNYAILAALATTAVFCVKRILVYSLSPVLALVPQIDMTGLIYPPYGMNVMIPAYVSFLEPTIASFVLFYLVRDALLRLNTLIKGLIIGGILIIIHGGIYSIVQIIYSEGNVPYRIFYYGQFLWEYLILGVLTACSFLLIESRNTRNEFLKFRQ